MTDIPPEAVTVAHDILWGGQMSEALVRRALEAAAPLIAAAERIRIAAAAEAAAFTLFRPGLGNGPAHGQSMRVVPLSELRDLIGDPDA